MANVGPGKEKEELVKMENTTRRDYLISIEKAVQKRWKEEKVFESEIPTDEAEYEKKDKWFGTFPFPYMNGSLHLGHSFSITKIEFTAGYQRMLGKRVLFPFGFHCTGMPIKAAADKIVREIELFGEDFSGYDAEVQADEAVASSSKAKSTDQSKSKKGKVAAKNTGLQYQFQIMESIGVPRAEIKKFADAKHWLSYFPNVAIEDLTNFGARIDWRRSFLTTDINPWYDSFVRWQMNRLRELNYVKYGKRNTIYSEKDGQPCMDHDRSSGEGVGPQEYTGIKMEVVEWGERAEEIKNIVEGKKVFFIAATLRPETMYGQTNCFVSSTIKYGIFASNKPNEYYLCTHRAARNMSYQDILKENGKRDLLVEVKGESLIGTKIKAPLSVHQQVHILPMETVLATKGTGVVTCVPSDSPDDWITLAELKKKAPFYKIDALWASAEPISVLSTPSYGDMSAKTLCEQLKVNSPKDSKQLLEAKEKAYQEGFYKGTMTIGPYKGQPVQDAKEKVKKDLLDAGDAFLYFEPESLVMSRSADECVVALCDQWYLDYGQDGWLQKAEKLVNRMELYNPETRHAFNHVLGWLHEWACSRTYGLGTRIPWDPQYLVEGLSDSTIYMAYYTICHLLHGYPLHAATEGPLGIKPEEMTDEIWDYLYSGKPFPENPSPASLSKEKADILKRHFEYWYPMTIRSSGKDLIGNHLTFCIYVHCALFDEKHWPLSMRANGHLMMNGAKMSKSSGNFATLKECTVKYGADATRMALADSGDGMDDANFEEQGANAGILRLFVLQEWFKEMMTTKDQLRTGPKDKFYDKVFESEINSAIIKAKEAYEVSSFKDALKYGFFELQLARDWYREACAHDGGMHVDLVMLFIRVQTLLMVPIMPHITEHIWSDVLGEKTSVQFARYPEPTSAVDRIILDQATYVRDVIKNARDGENTFIRRMSKSKDKSQSYAANKKKGVKIYTSSKFPEWQEKCVAIVKESYSTEEAKVNDELVKNKLASSGMLKDKRAMPFIQVFKRRITQFGADTAFNRTLLFEERTLLESLVPYLKRALAFDEVVIVSVEDGQKDGEKDTEKTAREASEPANPTFVFYSL
ncbi:leucine-tRNA ligase [Atractiella rhizophila]|nr:leucine-tRNA ligase [Atractiella rhizophila]